MLSAASCARSPFHTNTLSLLVLSSVSRSPLPESERCSYEIFFTWKTQSNVVGGERGIEQGEKKISLSYFCFPLKLFSPHNSNNMKVPKSSNVL